jgi:hypothetical protein
VATVTERSNDEEKLARPDASRGRWTSFVAPDTTTDQAVRGLHEQANLQHRLRVEHDRRTLLIHLSDEDGGGWTTFAVDRETRRWAVAQARRQADAASEAYDGLYRP